MPDLRELSVFKVWDQLGRPERLLVPRFAMESLIRATIEREMQVHCSINLDTGSPVYTPTDQPKGGAITFFGCQLLKFGDGQPWEWSDFELLANAERAAQLKSRGLIDA